MTDNNRLNSIRRLRQMIIKNTDSDWIAIDIDLAIKLTNELKHHQSLLPKQNDSYSDMMLQSYA